MRTRLLLFTANSLDALALRSALEQDETMECIHLADLRALWEMLAADSPDMLLLDLDMPESKGLALFQDILKKYPQSWIILTTAHGSPEEAIDAFRAGAADYLLQPISIEATLERLEAAKNRQIQRRTAEDAGRRNLVNQLAATINHEINNPLAAILGTAEVILGGDDKLDDKTSQYLEVIIEQSLRIREVIARLRDLPEIRIAPYGDQDTMVDLGGASAAHAESHPSVSGRRPVVLLVDGNAHLIGMLQRTFSSEIEIQGCPNGPAALERLRSDSPPDVVCINLNLADIDGISLIRLIRGITRSKPLFLLAPYHDDRIIRQALDAGASGVLYKPLRLLEFQKAIREALRSCQSGQTGGISLSVAVEEPVKTNPVGVHP